MQYRRYYPKGSKHNYVISNEQYADMIKKHGEDYAMSHDNASFEIFPETDEEAKELYFQSCQRVIDNPSFYLENLDKIPTFRVRLRKMHQNMP